MKIVATAFLALTACEATPALPWLTGLDHVVAATPRAPADETDDGCGAAASRPIELVADIAPAAGRETIVASFSGGIAVFDREAHLLSKRPGYRCEGSADELDVVAIGSAYGEPTLAIVATTGGHRETQTWIGLFHVARGGALDASFAGVVEIRDGERVTRGSITLYPGGLAYRRPGGPPRLWRLDRGAHVYVPVLPDLPHDEPLVSRR